MKQVLALVSIVRCVRMEFSHRSSFPALEPSSYLVALVSSELLNYADSSPLRFVHMHQWLVRKTSRQSSRIHGVPATHVHVFRVPAEISVCSAMDRQMNK